MVTLSVQITVIFFDKLFSRRNCIKFVIFCIQLVGKKICEKIYNKLIWQGHRKINQFLLNKINITLSSQITIKQFTFFFQINWMEISHIEYVLFVKIAHNFFYINLSWKEDHKNQKKSHKKIHLLLSHFTKNRYRILPNKSRRQFL